MAVRITVMEVMYFPLTWYAVDARGLPALHHAIVSSSPTAMVVADWLVSQGAEMSLLEMSRIAPPERKKVKSFLRRQRH